MGHLLCYLGCRSFLSMLVRRLIMTSTFRWFFTLADTHIQVITSHGNSQVSIRLQLSSSSADTSCVRFQPLITPTSISSFQACVWSMLLRKSFFLFFLRFLCLHVLPLYPHIYAHIHTSERREAKRNEMKEGRTEILIDAHIYLYIGPCSN